MYDLSKREPAFLQARIAQNPQSIRKDNVYRVWFRFWFVFDFKLAYIIMQMKKKRNRQVKEQYFFVSFLWYFNTANIGY